MNDIKNLAATPRAAPRGGGYQYMDVPTQHAALKKYLVQILIETIIAMLLYVPICMGFYLLIR